MDQAQQIPMWSLPERVHHVVQSCFDGECLLIVSGGALQEDDESIFNEVRAMRDGGGFGSIMGRNAFQREKIHALPFLDTHMKIYRGEIV